MYRLNQGRDLDGDGLADEVDPDNDGDTLFDLTEATGSAFSPATRTSVNATDTDGDGMSDAEEAVAGTDPTNPAAYLFASIFPFGPIDVVTGIETDPPPPVAFTSLVQSIEGVAIRWPARVGRTYTVLSTTNLISTPFAPIYTNLAAGPGAGPWQVVTNELVQSNFANRIFYKVQVGP